MFLQSIPMTLQSQSWSIRQWTSAPLRLETATKLQAPSTDIFFCLTDPKQMCGIFSWMHDITVDNRAATEANGLGAKRSCYFGNGMVLEEIIVGWQPPHRYAYRGVDETHPFGMIGHLGIIECRPEEGGTLLLWQHYFEHSNPKAMLEHLTTSVQTAINSLIERFNRSQTVEEVIRKDK
ncbi:MAG: SRPBCC family protein [Chloroflexota bacterium]